MRVSKTELQAKLLEYLQLAESREEEIVITDRGKPILKISRYTPAPTTEELFGPMRGKVQYFEDLTAPTIDEWTET